MNQVAQRETNGGTAVAHFQPARLPFHPEIQKRFGVDRAGWGALVSAVYPSAKTVDSVVMCLSYCRARNLDPFKRPVHIVPMWDAKKRAYVETIWPGIAELRTTAFRTGQYAGCDEAVFGADVEETFTGKVKAGDKWEEKSVTVRFPEWCRVTVYRLIGNTRVPFVGPKVYWRETYASIGKSALPNDMWAKRPRGQIEKCGEAGALRKAFPEEIGGLYAAEEMEGQAVIQDVGDQPALEALKEPTTVKAALDHFAGEEAATADASATAGGVEAEEPSTSSDASEHAIPASSGEELGDIPPELDRRHESAKPGFPSGGAKYSPQDSAAQLKAMQGEIQDVESLAALAEWDSLNTGRIARLVTSHQTIIRNDIGYRMSQLNDAPAEDEMPEDVAQ